MKNLLSISFLILFITSCSLQQQDIIDRDSSENLIDNFEKRQTQLLALDTEITKITEDEEGNYTAYILLTLEVYDESVFEEYDFVSVDLTNTCQTDIITNFTAISVYEGNVEEREIISIEDDGGGAYIIKLSLPGDGPVSIGTSDIICMRGPG